MTQARLAAVTNTSARLISSLENGNPKVQLDNGSKESFNYELKKDKLIYYIGLNRYEVSVYMDNLSGEKFACFELPLEYIHHDSLINPRGM
jgi:transcriptional regulator with XRE-family HTH domain